MEITSKTLLENPDKPFQILNDEQVKKLLLEFGMVGIFKHDKSVNQTQTITHDKHKTHLIIALLFTGNKLKSDNGYVMYCLPKSDPALIKKVQDEIAAAHDTVEAVVPIKTDAKTN